MAQIRNEDPVFLPPRTPHFQSNFLFSTFLSFDTLFIYGLLTSISSQIAFFFFVLRDLEYQRWCSI